MIGSILEQSRAHYLLLEEPGRKFSGHRPWVEIQIPLVFWHFGPRLAGICKHRTPPIIGRQDLGIRSDLDQFIDPPGGRGLGIAGTSAKCRDRNRFTRNGWGEEFHDPPPGIFAREFPAECVGLECHRSSSVKTIGGSSPPCPPRPTVCRQRRPSENQSTSGSMNHRQARRRR